MIGCCIKFADGIKRVCDGQILLTARGGIEAHGAKVFHAAVRLGGHVIGCVSIEKGIDSSLRIIDTLHEVDVVNLPSPLDASNCCVLFHSSARVLAGRQLRAIRSDRT